MEGAVELLMFPIAIAFVGMIASIIGSFLVRSGDSTDSKALSRALHMGTNVAMAITVVATVGVALLMFGDDELFDQPIGLAISVIGGLLVGWGLGKCAEYFTSDTTARSRRSPASPRPARPPRSSAASAPA